MADEVENPVVEETTGEEDKGFMEEVLAEVIRRTPEEDQKEGGDEEPEEKKEEGPKESDEQQPEESKEEEQPEESKEEDEGKKEEEEAAKSPANDDPEPTPATDDDKKTDETKKEETSEITEDTEKEAKEKKEASPKQSPEKKKKDRKTREPVEEIVVPHLLSDEALSEKGVPATEMESYKRFYLKQAFAPKTWYESLKDHTFETKFLTLSNEEVDLLLAMHHSPSDDPPELTDQHKETLEGLKEKIETIIKEYGEAGAFLRLNTKTPTDSVLERNDCDYIQSIQEGVTTEMEIENQFANAYLIWRSWRSSSFRESNTQPRGNNVLRRSLRRIQKSFRPATGGRTQSRSKEEGDSADPLAEENKKNEEDGKVAEEATPNVEATPTTESAGEGPITVEATIEGTQAEPETQTTTETETKTAENSETQTAAAETTETETQTPQTETETANTGTEEAQTDDDSAKKEEEKKEEKGEEEGENKGEEGKVEEKEKDGEKEEETKKEEENKESRPKSLLKETSPPSEEHQMIKVKQETLQNKVLRGFMRTIFTRYRVKNADEAIALLTTSLLIKEELEQVKKFVEIEGTEAVLAIMKWVSTDLPRYPGMNFRAFVYNNMLTAVTQHDDILYVPNIARFKKTILSKIQYFFDNDLKPAMEKEGNYIVDLFLAPNKIFVTELHPFHQSTGACLFTWQQSQKVLMGGGGNGTAVELRHIHTPFKKCFTGLLPHWQTVCETVTQNKRGEDESTGNKCVIL
ncbi:PREDICTED: FK506-binding protein 5-like isoform X1 [Amphimedon queenslandica]|uniref:Cell division cycle protein 123 homolog n=1 Tax=Amphimedon queenslandica TaxID=400682 RepID=A0AAN0IW70_AMPQE|nr:PREDICTED: FK506-binding protein 5-like isoform X1 [Amphimedon queenslandica]|eukprot:XP_019849035.1 PREDICTED: FK506-binding protein 5-like isoform X1 [Amphimedon queenslandica]